MYVAAHFAMSPAQIADVLSSAGAADLVTLHAGGMVATFLPFIFDPGAGEHGALLGHVARNNDQWRHATGGEALVIVHGTDHYVSPSWLPSAAQGTVVPTWDYVTLHVYGSLVAHDDPEWTGTVVRRLTERHESTVTHPWTVEGAKPGYVEAMMRAIVGLELQVTRVEAKAKMAQNKTPEDVAALAGALQAGGDLEGAAFLREVSLPAAVRRAQTLADVAAGRHHRTPAGT